MYHGLDATAQIILPILATEYFILQKMEIIIKRMSFEIMMLWWQEMEPQKR